MTRPRARNFLDTLTILRTLPAPPTTICIGCAEYAKHTVVFTNYDTMEKRSYRFCDEHADAFAYKHYGPYLKRIEEHP